MIENNNIEYFDNTDFCTIKELYARNYPPAKWLIKGLIPEQGITLISAAPASFKTWLTLEITKTIASGEKFLNDLETVQSGVLFMDEESGCRQLKQRCEKLGISENLPILISSFNNIKFDLKDAERNTQTIEQIIDQCQNGRNIKLVIFDSLIRFHNADENSSREMSAIFDCFKELKKKGIASVIICHTRKGLVTGTPSGYLGDTIRGSSDILAACDVSISVARNKDGSITIRQAKNRLSEELSPIKIKLIPDGDMCKWNYIQMYSSDTQLLERLRQDILSYVGSETAVQQRRIIEECQRMNGKYSQAMIKEQLNTLISSGQICCRPGHRKEKLYFIPNPQDNTESK